METAIKEEIRPLSLDVVCLQKGKVYIPSSGQSNLAFASTVQSHLMQYRYMLSTEAFQRLCTATVDEIIFFHNTVIGYLRSVTGGAKAFRPFYGDFPIEIMSEEDSVHMSNQMIHYLTNGQWLPTVVPMAKPIEFEKVTYNVLELTDNPGEIFTSLVSINQSLTPEDLRVVEWFVKSGNPLTMPSVIPFKENLCTLAAMGIEGLPIKTPTDVLRIAVHMSGGDISLPKVPGKTMKTRRYGGSISGTAENPARNLFKFKKFSRKERRYLLGLLETTSCDSKEMVLKDERWKRLGEILHPGEYSKQYPRTAAAFHEIRNTKVRSWYSRLTDAFNVKLDLALGLKILSERPGEFVRRIDWLVRTFADMKSISAITSAFIDSAKGASNKVLYELYAHFEKRVKPTSGRKVIVKGARKPTKLPELPAIPQTIVTEIQETILHTLKMKFSKLEKLGKVWIDPELYKIPLPTNMRSMNFALKPVMRGQRTPIDNKDAKVVRPYFHWTDKNGDYDPDLSVTFVGMGVCKVLNFSSIRVGKSVHSGDIIKVKGDCAEYVDIHIADARSLGYRYALVDVRSYHGGPLSDMNGVFGIMEREHPHANKTWLPETVVNCHALESTATTTLIAIIDLQEMEYIYLDIDSSGSVNAVHDVDNTLEIIRSYSELPKLSVAHLLAMHAEARGEITTNKEEATTVFNFEEFSHSYEKAGAYMGV